MSLADTLRATRAAAKITRENAADRQIQADNAEIIADLAVAEKSLMQQITSGVEHPSWAISGRALESHARYSRSVTPLDLDSPYGVVYARFKAQGIKLSIAEKNIRGDEHGYLEFRAGLFDD